MRYAILGDIHSNLSALTAVLDSIDRAGVDAILSVGDVVGYGPSPQECITLLRERHVAVVKGNHDAACAGELGDQTFNRYARAALTWTRAQLPREMITWLKDLPMMLQLEHCQVAHGSVHEPSEYTYVRTTGDANPALDIMTRPLAFVGHTHIPIALLRLRDLDTRTVYAPTIDLDLSESERCLVNVGSVGQPRDEDHRTGWVLFDSAAETVRIERLTYDIEREAHRIRAVGLPKALGDRLYLGV